MKSFITVAVLCGGLCVADARSSAEEIQFYAAMNLITLEVPDGMESVFQTDPSSFSKVADGLIPDTQEVHELFAQHNGEMWEPNGRRVFVATWKGNRSLAIDEFVWKQLRQQFVSRFVEGGELRRLSSVQDIVRDTASYLRVDDPREAPPLGGLFLDRPTAVGGVACLVYDAEFEGRRVRTRILWASVYKMVNGTPMLFHFTSKPINESNLEAEATWVLDLVDEVVESTDTLNPWTFGDVDRLNQQVREAKREMLMWLFVPLIILLAAYAIKRLWRSA